MRRIPCFRGSMMGVILALLGVRERVRRAVFRLFGVLLIMNFEIGVALMKL
jgi:hypothetical protein